jgi:hypothetical protein
MTRILLACAVVLVLVSSAFGEYVPKLGRFLQRDPAGFRDGMNLYEYVGSRSTAFTDPTGQFLFAYSLQSASDMRDYLAGMGILTCSPNSAPPDMRVRRPR